MFLKPFLPSLVLGQTRKRVAAALPPGAEAAVAAAAAGGAAQAVAAALLGVAPALEAAASGSSGSGSASVPVAAMRGAAGFVVFFCVFEKTKKELLKAAKTTTTVSKTTATAIKLLAAVLAAVSYRLTTWWLDGRLPMRQLCDTDDPEEAENEKTFGGKRGGNPYELILSQVKTSILKASISMVFMDLILGRPSW